MPEYPTSWEPFLTDELEEWLLAGEPWVVYRVLTDLLGKDDADNRVAMAKAEIHRHPFIKKIFTGLNKDGYWGKPKDIHTWWPRKDTTFWILPILADLGLTKDDRRIARACEYIFSTQLESGAFGWDPPTKPGECHTSMIVESLAKLGWLSDARLKKAYSWLIRRQRLDGGFWCKDTAQIGGPREKEPGCPFATTYVLGALAQDAALRDCETASKGVDILFECWHNKGKIKYAGHDSQIGRDWEKLKYPFTDYKILKVLDALSQFDQAKKRLKTSGMIELLLQKRDEKGRYRPESIVRAWPDFDFAQKEKPSRWITFLSLRVLKRVLG